MENKKKLIISSTIIVVVLAVFIGMKLLDTNVENAGLNQENLVQQAKDEIDKLAEDGIINENQSEDETTIDEQKDESAFDDQKTEEGTDNQKTEEGINQENNDKLVEENNRDKEEKKEKESANEEGLKEIYVFRDKYIVKEKETLGDIALKCLQVNDLRDNNILVKHAKDLIVTINNIENPNIIKVGSELMIPTRKNFEGILPDGTAYEVQQGDTMYTIVKLQMTWCEDVQEGIDLIMTNNNLETAQDLKAGAVIYIPDELNSNEV